ncbi:M10 family metallopeptidase C-terminal domain-containing protein [Mesorhizobium yinganensis]|uniref:M10 family metallopeptidase C-terminal domain-containing protein n=1 Tax=Mesorhizobium yinganensis TaxID=3157707 RepID=UPI0032B75D28
MPAVSAAATAHNRRWPERAGRCRLVPQHRQRHRPSADRLFAALNESGIGAAKADQITDFAPGDKIDISKIDAVADGDDNAFKLDAGGAFVAGEIHQTLSGGNLVIDFNVDGDAAAEMSIVLVGQTTLLAAADFIL